MHALHALDAHLHMQVTTAAALSRTGYLMLTYCCSTSICECCAGNLPDCSHHHWDAACEGRWGQRQTPPKGDQNADRGKCHPATTITFSGAFQEHSMSATADSHDAMPCVAYNELTYGKAFCLSV